MTDQFDAEGDYYLVKTDTNGNILWEETMGTQEVEYGLSVNTTTDGGYLMLGESRGYGADIGFYLDALLIKTDSVGNELWRKTWGNETNDCAWNVETTPDDGIIACGCLSISDNDYEKRGYLRKMSATGQVVWHREFFLDSLQQGPLVFRMCRVLDNGNIVAVGEGSAKHGLDYSLVPWFVMLDPDGNVLVSRPYTSIITGESLARIYDIHPTSEGGFITAGEYLPFEGDTGSQDMFILKLDSAGCEYPGCMPPLGTGPPPATLMDNVHFSAWPNPFGRALVLESLTAREGVVIIRDLGGRELARTAFPAGTHRVSMDVHGLAPGVYIAELMDKGIAVKALKIVKF